MTSYQHECKQLITFCRSGVLSTHSVTNAGYPFGSVTPYDLSANGEIVLYVSSIAEHFKNIAGDRRASLTVADPFGVHDPQPHARATVLLDFARVPKEASSGIQASYFKRFPSAAKHSLAHDFCFLQGEIQRIRWIGGFGQIGWISKEEFSQTPTDPLTYAGAEIAAHMNEDHRDALFKLAQAQVPTLSYESLIELVEIRTGGFVIRVRNKNGEQRISVPFLKPLESPAEARGAMVELLKNLP